MGKILKYGCLGTLGFLVLIGIIGAISGGGSKSPAVAVATPAAQAAAPATAPAAKEAPAPTSTPAARPTNTLRPTLTAVLGTRENPAPMGVDVQVKDARRKIVKAEVKDALPATFGPPKKAQGKVTTQGSEQESGGCL